LILVPTVSRSANADLLEMLSRVPATALSDGGIVNYVDHRAVEEAQPGAAQPRSFAEWALLADADDIAFDLWMAAFRGTVGGAPELLGAFSIGGEDWAERLGFDFFELDRQVTFGQPPESGLILGGTFDTSAITAAFEARHFSSEELGQWSRLCGAAGCDAGMEMDLGSRDPTDPLGGNLGQRRPLLVSQSTLMSSASAGTIEAMLVAAGEPESSLAGLPAIQLAVEALPADGLLRQATVIEPGMLNASVEGLDQELEGIDIGPLPAYELALFADTATDTEQIAYVALVYEDEAGARSAADVLPSRLALEALTSDGTVGELLMRRGASVIEARVNPAADGSGAVTLLELRGSLPEIDPDDFSRSDSIPSRAYQALFELLMRRDVLWLTPA
jgi:hypothetical protein